MIKEDLITYETALLAKSKGFSNIKTIIDKIQHEYVDSGANPTGEYYHKYQEVTKEVIPTQAVLTKWLRDVHNIVIIIDYATHQDDEPIGHITYYCMINKFTPEIFTSPFNESSEDDGITEYYDTYEQALEEGLKAALKLI